MNAAFLLVTSAWFTGQGPMPAPAMNAAPVPAATATASGGPIIASSGGSCSNCGGGQSYAPASSDACCDSGHGHRLKGMLSGLFNRGGSCGCETQTCDTGCGHARKQWFHKSQSCDTCDSGCGSSSGGFFAKLKGLCHKRGGSDCGCATGGCDSGCGSSTPYVGGTSGSMGTMNPTPAPTGGEIITAPPKKLGNPPAVNPAPVPAPKVGRVNTPSAPIAPSAPSVEVAPPLVPSIDADRREPF